MQNEIKNYNATLSDVDRKICNALMRIIENNLPQSESKVWHRHPVWFLEGNPIVGYSKIKAGVRLMFWSGADFDESDLKPGSGKFKDASILYTNAKDINETDIQRWLSKAAIIQWDYKNIYKRKGKLIRLR